MTENKKLFTIDMIGLTGLTPGKVIDLSTIKSVTAISDFHLIVKTKKEEHVKFYCSFGAFYKGGGILDLEMPAQYSLRSFLLARKQLEDLRNELLKAWSKIE